ncbi:hypothetical protein CROQUDRAFT_105376 [Cronartium quercuum f. sp. fusiforme G11]|uniref:Uncharacterized protein n=1 Tax=Cronartium quercuum f. sp. fusiforme G11 TaxID=708437 RepID=A0A9P6NL41_9BASI|nr:hypothetical protein CROQUDRAFT_105376 [Cronartium quercuum f. sp. fusiforme G11]
MSRKVWHTAAVGTYAGVYVTRLVAYGCGEYADVAYDSAVTQSAVNPHRPTDLAILAYLPLVFVLFFSDNMSHQAFINTDSTLSFIRSRYHLSLRAF